MDGVNLIHLPRRDDPLRQQIGRLIETAGSDDFAPALFRISHAVTRCSHMTAFVSAPGTAPRTVFAVNDGPHQVALQVAQRYVRHYWQMDPANDMTHRNPLPEDGVALKMCSKDIDATNYREDCYTGVHLNDRFSLIRRDADCQFRLNFYASDRNRALQAEQLERLIDSADLLLALVRRHHDHAAPEGETAQDDFYRRLRRLRADMPHRELQICASIARGLTSEGIALEHGIAVNTVLTYRKRAYARLGISSQNELIKLILGSLSSDNHRDARSMV